MTSVEAFEGTKVRVLEHHRIAEQRGMVGEVVGCYGGEEFVAVDVHLSNGERRLFWPGDLDEVYYSRRSWWHSLLG